MFLFAILLESKIPQLTLISCNPATLARDLGILSGRLIEQEGELIKNPAYADLADGETLNGYYAVERAADGSDDPVRMRAVPADGSACRYCQRRQPALRLW